MVKLTWSAIAPEWGGRQRAGIDVGKKKKNYRLEVTLRQLYIKARQLA